MTALKEYDRLEAIGLWRPAPDAQRREVIVSLGDATLTMTDMTGRALAHWSLAAVRRGGSGLPALYHPDGDPGETLELPEDETVMIDGIARIMRSIDRRRPKPGYLRLVLRLGFGLTFAAAAIFWLPGALERYAVDVVPPVKRSEIGTALLSRMARVAGQPCNAASARDPLRRLALRVLGPGREDLVYVLPGGVPASAHLPGRIILLNRAIIEDHDDVDVAAGYILAEKVRAEARDPLAALLDHAGLVASLRLLTTGALPADTLDAYAEHMLTDARKDSDPEALLTAFEAADLRSTPYAYARDITGETTLALIEADPRARTGSREVLSDADWVRLQGILRRLDRKTRSRRSGVSAAVPARNRCHGPGPARPADPTDRHRGRPARGSCPCRPHGEPEARRRTGAPSRTVPWLRW